MKVLSNDKQYLCFHWIYILKWVIKEVLLQLAVSIKEHSRCLTTTATTTKNINGEKKKAHTAQFSKLYYFNKI